MMTFGERLAEARTNLLCVATLLIALWLGGPYLVHNWATIKSFGTQVTAPAVSSIHKPRLGASSDGVSASEITGGLVQMKTNLRAAEAASQ